MAIAPITDTSAARAAAASAAVAKAQKSVAPNLMGGGQSILGAGGSLLDAGRRINRSGIGMSASSRQLLEGFYNNASAIFNQLYTKAENGEASNVLQIKALRSKYSYLVKPEILDDGSAAKSTTTGTNVDETA